jgi:hypothetical protein
MTSNAGPGCTNCKMSSDSMCTGFWNNGGCGGIDAGRCGVTPDGAMQFIFCNILPRNIGVFQSSFPEMLQSSPNARVAIHAWLLRASPFLF